MTKQTTLRDFGYTGQGNQNNNLVKAVIAGLEAYIISQEEPHARDHKSLFGKGPNWARQMLDNLRKQRSEDCLPNMAYNETSQSSLGKEKERLKAVDSAQTLSVKMAIEIANEILANPSKNEVSKFTKLSKALINNGFTAPANANAAASLASEPVEVELQSVQKTSSLLTSHSTTFGKSAKQAAQNPRKHGAVVEWLAKHTYIPSRF